MQKSKGLISPLGLGVVGVVAGLLLALASLPFLLQTVDYVAKHL